MIRLVLPLPDSLNRWPKHPMAEHAAKRKYQKQLWPLACSQAKPSHEPPEQVRISSTFYVRNIRDHDNLKGSLKWVLDALKLKQKITSYEGLRWRSGIADEKGFFVDDDPKHCIVADPIQNLDRKDPRLELVIEALPKG